MLEAQVQALRVQVPEERLRAAATARAQGNEELAINIFEQVLAWLAPTVCREIAQVEVALTVDAGDRPHLQRAERLT